MNKTILLVFGTRPEAIKMAPLVKAFQAEEGFETKVCVTAQHREMLDQVLDFFEIQPEVDLDLMKPGQNLFSLTGDIINGLKDVLEELKPDYVFVHGDTTTTLASSLATYYSRTTLCHIEAGLRTHNKYAPFPEEINRSVTGRIADFHFAPTEKAKANLLAENIQMDQVLVTGNTVIDALFESLELLKTKKDPLIQQLEEQLDLDKDLVLVTGHRRENFGEGFLNICQALKTIALEQPQAEIVYPVHLNPNVQKPVYELLSETDNIKLIDPLPYPAFVWLMNQSKIVITDSGGIQEEAPSLGKPVLVMRETTERPEAVDAGTVVLVGTDKGKISSEALDLLTKASRYEAMSKLHNPYGDGKACARIVQFIKNQQN